MDERTHAKAQQILTRLCVGRTVAGLGFVAEPVLTLGDYSSPEDRGVEGPAEVYLHIEAGCMAVLPQASAAAPGAVLGLVELAGLAVSLRGVPIVGASLGYPKPQLELRFGNGAILSVNGHDPQYEPWSIGAGEWSVYALANDEITWGVPHPAFAPDAA
jgi:hypothetical protein